MRWILVAGVLLISGVAQASYIEQQPGVGEKRTVSAGAEVFSSKAVATAKGFKLEQEAALDDSYPAGTLLLSVPTKASYKGCMTAEGTLTPYGTCFLDDDGDGTFDRSSSYGSLSGASKLKMPVRYSLTDVPYPNQSSLRRVLVYQGADAGTLKINYREFSGTLARPAFNEELSIPLSKEFPQKVAAKGVIFTIFKIDGLGLSYQIDSAEGF